MVDENFAVFILTHGRAENVITLKALEKAGYSGKTYLVVDDEDEQEDLYREKYGEQVIQFCKKEAATKTDVMTPSKKRNAVVFARNECWNIAKRLGLTYFCVLDDDYKQFLIRFIDKNKIRGYEPKNIDNIFTAMCEFLDVSGAITVCMAQGGDYIGGGKRKFHP